MLLPLFLGLKPGVFGIQMILAVPDEPSRG
jgi:hypothetical protein